MSSQTTGVETTMTTMSLPTTSPSTSSQLSSMALPPPSSLSLSETNLQSSDEAPANSTTLLHWQERPQGIRERLVFAFNAGLLTDVQFFVGSSKQFAAHRLILSLGSAVFDAMFHSQLNNGHSKQRKVHKEDDEDEDKNLDVIAIPDVDPVAFHNLLTFLYTDVAHCTAECVMSTLYAAKKYAVPMLEQRCLDFLRTHLSADNAFLLLTQARLFDESKFADQCLEVIDKYTAEAIQAENFIDIDVQTLEAVIERDALRIREAKLFNAVISWARAECTRRDLDFSPENLRSVLAPILPKLRFPLMTIEEFAQGPAQSGILTDRECVSLFLHFTVRPAPPVSFPCRPRCSMSGNECVARRFNRIESRWGYSGTSDKIRFMTDHKVFVVGFGLYGAIHGSKEYQVLIQLLDAHSKLVGSNECSFMSDGTSATFKVFFKEPLEVSPNVHYTACATLKGPDSHYGIKGVRRITCSTPSGTVTFQFSYAADNNNGTTVEDGQIPEIIFYT